MVRTAHPTYWGFRWDMTNDGVFTISDVWALLYSLFFYPGDWVIAELIINTKFGVFFEFSETDYGGFCSAVISFIIWLVLFAIPGNIIKICVEDYEDYKIKSERKKTSQKQDNQ